MLPSAVFFPETVARCCGSRGKELLSAGSPARFFGPVPLSPCRISARTFRPGRPPNIGAPRACHAVSLSFYGDSVYFERSTNSAGLSDSFGFLGPPRGDWLCSASEPVSPDFTCLESPVFFPGLAVRPRGVFLSCASLYPHHPLPGFFSHQPN